MIEVLVIPCKGAGQGCIPRDAEQYQRSLVGVCLGDV